MPTTESDKQIAIVGVGGVFPGALDINTFWNNVKNGIDSGRHVPSERWFLAPQKAFDAVGPKPDRVYSTWGCFIDDFSVDVSDLNLAPDFVERLDQLFHLGLHAARAAFNDAGRLRTTDLNRVGVILGNIALPTESTSAMCRDILGRTFIEKLVESLPITTQDSDPLNAALLETDRHFPWHPTNRQAASLPAAVIGEALNLGGTAFTLDAACASSLYALKFACEELRAHRADAMLAGGMSRPDCQYTQMGFAQLKALSRSGRCAPLSAAADGLVVGEGAGVFVLKRLRDAIEAGDHIYGVIAGIGLSNDRGANLLAPHSEGQLRAMQAAYREAGWQPADVDLIECHATGTPVGDSVEIASLHQLWEDQVSQPGQCIIGGVKSNVGHLLTGAGAAGLMKVLLAIRHQTLPPTANFLEPAQSMSDARSPFRVLAKAEPWVRRESGPTVIPRRATVNAFGFGGINAHVLIEEYLGPPVMARHVVVGRPSVGESGGGARPAPNGGSPAPSKLDKLDNRIDIAIVGLAAQGGTETDLGPANSIEDSQFGTRRSHTWGVEHANWFLREFGLDGQTRIDGLGSISSVTLPIGGFRIPPLEMQDMLPQQQLMLKAAHAALCDANNERRRNGALSECDIPTNQLVFHASEEFGNQTGVFIGIELDPNTTNFHLRWSIEEQAKEWAKRLGLILSDSELANWIEQLKDSVSPPLSANRVMGNLGGIVASRLAREFNVGGPSFTISSGENSGLRACELAANALRRGELDRALVGAVDLPCDVRNVVSALRDDRLDPAESFSDFATAIVLKRLDDAQRNGDRIHAVIRHIDSHGQIPSCEFPQSSVSTGAATGLVDLVHAARSLGGRHACSDRPILRNRRDGLRHVGVRGRDVDGTNLSFELFEAPMGLRSRGLIDGSLESVTDKPEAYPTFGLFVIDGESIEEIASGLEQLRGHVDSALTIADLAKRWFHARPPRTVARLAMTFAVKSVDELREAIPLGLARLDSNSSSSSADRRIHFSTSPLATIGRLAFVFPGSGNAFAGMGRELLETFPDVLRRQDAENERLKDQYRPELIWNGSTSALLDDHKAMIFGQVALGTAICDLLSNFKIRPTASIGYSLGESAALFGLRAWTDRDEMLQRMDDATLFGSDLVRPFDAARRAWSIPDGEPVEWISGVIDCPVKVVRSAISDDSSSILRRVYLLIVNTPNQCVIGGQRDAVERLVRRTNGIFVPFSAPSTVHCEILRQVEPAYRQLHLMRTSSPPREAHIDFYSTAWGRAYTLTRESAAEAIVAQAIDTIDFPRVIEKAYADGCRLFVEIGPGASCTRMICDILGDRPYFAQSATPATSDPVRAVVELLAMLIAERVPVDLGYVYGRVTDDARRAKSAGRQIVTQTGGMPFQIPVPAGGWKLEPAQIAEAGVRREGEAHAELRTGDTHRLTGLAGASQSFRVGATSDHLCVPCDETHASRPVIFESPRRTNGTPIQLSALHGTNVMTQLEDMLAARQQAHETYLRVSAEAQQIMAVQLELLATLSMVEHESSHRATAWPSSVSSDEDTTPPKTPEQWHDDPLVASWNDPVRLRASTTGASAKPERPGHPFAVQMALNSDLETPPRFLSRPECMEFAIGKIGRALGRTFAEIDQHPTRVRLPDEPLMLVDRILEIDGEPLSMTSGRVVTEHDIHSGAWYLDGNRIPTCIAVEAGQADLFLSGWLGIDLETKGLASYRLLDAVVTFHRALPQPGKTIHYDIRINHFFRQGKTYLFRFEFEATVDGQSLLTMREGCAGFFTEAELASGKGIVHTALDRQPRPGKRPNDWRELVPMSVESYDDTQLLALRRGELDSCFGPLFAGLPLARPMTIPGIAGNEGDSATAIQGVTKSRMWLVDRVLKLDPTGGKFGMGMILGELDIHPDDWFLTCHFCDDQVMPGTLMYECCLHTLRIYLLRMGWISEEGQIVYEPIPGIKSRLKCRGQVRANTKKVWYEITLKEIGYTKYDGDSTQSKDTAYCIADALMYADGKPIVEITDMSVRLSGLSRADVEQLWKHKQTSQPVVPALSTREQPTYSELVSRRAQTGCAGPALFDTERITAFAIGNPSEAFGDRYRVFDSERVIARLPGPPFQFLDRIVAISGCEPWQLRAGGEVVAQYDVPPDAWYFQANRQRRMPFAVLLETALQPCGWLAAYVGSALTSDVDLSFRNLGGTATQFQEVTPESGTLTTTVKMTRVSNSGGMIIQHYDFDLRCNGEPVYTGNTYFGFFSKASLANQIGIRDAKPFGPPITAATDAVHFRYINAQPFADSRFQMIDNVQLSLRGGPSGHGYAIGTTSVDPSEWFFKAHFHQDPVVPGSLGLESFFQLLKFYAAQRWQLGCDAEFATPIVEGTPSSFGAKHEWVYRGQVIPRDQLVTVSAVITQVDDARKELVAEGYLSVDGRTIYQMKQFSLAIR